MAIDVRKPLKKLLPHLLQARTENLNEADTVQRLIKVFEEVLGYDAMSEISREAQLKGKYIDIVLKIDGVVRMLVEAKAASEKLRDRHIDQALSYASRNNYRWVVLTNSLDWILYHLTFDQGIEYERAFLVDLATESSLDVAACKLALLHRQSIKKGELDDFWNKTRALNPVSIAKALFKEEVLMLIRREIRREEGLLVDPEDLATSIQEMLSTETREKIGPVRIRKRHPKLRHEGSRTSPQESVPVDGLMAMESDRNGSCDPIPPITLQEN